MEQKEYTTVFLYTEKEEFEKVKSILKEKVKGISIKRNNQIYAMGGFNITKRGGLTAEEIDTLRNILVELKYDTTYLDLLNDKIFDSDKGEFAGTKVNHLIFKNGIYFLRKVRRIY